MTSIEWVKNADGSQGLTWNPIRGCTRVSPGCGGPGPHGGCYAEGIAARFSGPGQPYEGIAEMRGGKPRWTGKLAFVENALTAPLRRRKPTTWFVNSMSDLFHEAVPDEWIDRIFAVMALAPQHTFQVLTKRPARMRAYLSASRAHPVGLQALGITLEEASRNPRSTVGTGCILQGDICHLQVWPLPNVWAGVSAEDQQRADERVPDLLATPAAVRFVSAEPLLGPVDFSTAPARCYRLSEPRHRAGWMCPLTGDHQLSPVHADHRGARLDWIIVGGESGPNARPMHPAWARSIRDQCAAAGVAFHFKQWGAWEENETGLAMLGGTVPDSRNLHDSVLFSDGIRMNRVGKKAAGRRLDGIEHNGMPEMAHV